MINDNDNRNLSTHTNFQRLPSLSVFPRHQEKSFKNESQERETIQINLVANKNSIQIFKQQSLAGAPTFQAMFPRRSEQEDGKIIRLNNE
jgi:hypothetical protein